jgi:hypothetical protein
MAVHVDEIHTQLSATTTGSAPAVGGGGAPGHESAGASSPARPGAGEDSWRRAEARVRQLRSRVCAEGFDD